MNYYKRHLGDYARDTGHLTALEHGIYTLLLDWYYVNECPIPFDKAIRIARGNPEQTQMVLDEFFKRQETGEKGWIHSRADREIKEYRTKAERNREVGKLGGRPKKTKTVSKRNPDVTLATSHKPLAIKKQSQKQRGANAPKVEFPDWLPQSAWDDWHNFRNSRRGWTHKAKTLSLGTLTKLREKGHDPTAVIEQSIERPLDIT